MGAKITPSLLCLLSLVVMMVACADSSSPAWSEPEIVELSAPAAEETEQGETQIELRLLGWSTTDPEDELWRLLAEECGATLELIPRSEYTVRLESTEDPDILYVDTVQLPYLAELGLLEPLEQTPDQGEFYGSVLDAFAYQGKTFAIPREMTALALYYNRDLFDVAGLAYPTNEWTWSDLKKDASEIYYITGVPGLAVPASPAYFAAFVYQNGGRIMTKDFTETLIDGQEAVGAFQFLLDARNDGWATFPTASATSLTEYFGAGEVAMTVGTQKTERYLLDSFPDLNYGAVHLPAGPESREGNLFTSVGYAVASSSENRAAAFEAITCLTSEQNQIQSLDWELALPSRKFLDGHPFVQESPAAMAVATHIEDASPLGWGPEHTNIFDIIQDALEQVLQGNSSVEESLVEAAEKIRNLNITR